MKLLPKDRQIYVSGRVWHEYYPKINVTPFIYALYENIDLAKYGNGLKRFLFTYIVTKPDGFYEPVVIFDKTKKEADISIVIPNEVIENATEEETIKIMEAIYLQGIDKLNSIKEISNFDVATFKKDVEAIFAKEKWYELAMTA
ncbi:MAG: hypothetical protein SFU99_03180 [Saprospiraceae bacterium]|nr:hypothetical protein [Saprospiraceae bacterium]